MKEEREEIQAITETLPGKENHELRNTRRFWNLGRSSADNYQGNRD
jgi:hypothetical protein